MNQTKINKGNHCLPTFSVIAAASSGDVEAINAVLKHYQGYINTLATRELRDEYGNVYYGIDGELRRRLETKLITKILQFKIAV